MNNEKIGKLIASLRKEKNITQYELSEMIPIGREAISKWERGKTCPDYSSMLRLSEIFNISINEILYGERETKTNKEEITNIPIKLYEDKTKLKKKLNKLIIFIFIILIFFLSYFFITNYNSLKVYKIDCNDKAITILDGLLIKTREMLYFDLGNIETKEDVEYLKLYYKYNNKDNLIVKTQNKTINFEDSKGYNEYIDFKLFNKIINNLYLEIKYKDHSKVIKLNLEKYFSNDYIIPKKTSLSSYDYQSEETSFKLDKETTKIKNKIKKNFTKQDDGYVYNKNKNLTFTYMEDIELLHICYEKDKITKYWQYNLSTHNLNFEEYKNSKLTNDFSYYKNKIECNIEKCNNEKEIINEFNSLYNSLK